PCDIDGICGDGGSNDLSGCDVTIAANGRVLSRAPGRGGENRITARKQLRIDGVVSAETSQVSGDDGSNTVVHPLSIAAIGLNKIQPAATEVQPPFCPGNAAS